MPFTHVCAHCKKFIRENRSKNHYARKASEDRFKKQLFHFNEHRNDMYKDEDYICPKFQAELYNFWVKTDGNNCDVCSELPLKKRRPNIPEIAATTETSASTRSGQPYRPNLPIPPVENTSNLPRASTSAACKPMNVATTTRDQSDSEYFNDENFGQEITNHQVSAEKRRPLQEQIVQSSPSITTRPNGMDMEQSGSGRVSLDSSQRSNLIQAEAIYSQSSSDFERTVREIIAEHKIRLDDIISVPSTQAKCLICDDASSDGRKTIPDQALLDMWIEEEILIPKKSRCCLKHIEHESFLEVAKVEIRKRKKRGIKVCPKEVQKLLCETRKYAVSNRNVINFDSASTEEAVYYEMTGLTREKFDILLEYTTLSIPRLYDTKNRSARNALGIFLTKLRLGVSQRVIARLYGTSRSVVGAAIQSVKSCLMDRFVKENLGYDHIKREEVLLRHNPQYVRDLFDIEGENMALLADGTYIFIQQSKNHKLQSETYSPHKHRNLVKYMMIVTPDGYILSAPGPYKSDGRHGDSNIMNDIVENKDKDKLMEFLIPGDHLIADRGFQRSVDVLEGEGVRCSIPPNLNGRSAFEVEEANLSRRVTLVRWVVEAVNGRIKNIFDFFNNVVPTSYVDSIGDLFHIACAIINRFSPPIFTESEKHKKIVKRVKERLNWVNRLQQEIECNAEGLQRRGAFKKGIESDVPDFPRLTEDDLFDLTLGIYQTNNAESYIMHHLDKDNLYKLLLHKEDANLIRAQLRSKFRRSIKHNLWVEYDTEQDGADSVTGYYCECQIGARIIGMCSHVTAVIWYLGYERHQTVHKKKKSYSSHLLDVAESIIREEYPGHSAEDDDAVVLFVPETHPDSNPSQISQASQL